MKMYKLLLALLLPLLLTGCWDALELEEQAYVIAIGVDYRPDGQLDVTFQIQNPEVGSSSLTTAAKEPAQVILTLVAPDKVAARGLANSSISRQITFSHAKVFVIGENLAKNKELFTLFEAIERDPEIRREMDIIVVKGKAADFLRENSPQLETRPHKFYAFMDQRWKNSGLVPVSTVDRFIQRVEEDVGAFLAIYADIGETNPKPSGMEDKYLPGEVDKYGGNPVQMIGSAVLRKGKMIGSITGEETRLTLLLRPHAVANHWYATYPDPLQKDAHITVRLLKQRPPKIKIDVSKPVPKIDVEVHVDMQIMVIRSFIDYVEDLQKQKILKNAIEKYLDTAAMKLVERSQKEFKADIFQWSLKARQKFWSIPDFEAYDWLKSYPKAEVNVHFNVHFTEFGKQLSPMELKKIED